MLPVVLGVGSKVVFGWAHNLHCGPKANIMQVDSSASIHLSYIQHLAWTKQGVLDYMMSKGLVWMTQGEMYLISFSLQVSGLLFQPILLLLYSQYLNQQILPWKCFPALQVVLVCSASTSMHRLACFF